MDTSRFPEGLVIESALTTTRPLNAIVRDTAGGDLWVQVDAPNGTNYVQLTNSSLIDPFPDCLTIHPTDTGVDYNSLTAAIASGPAAGILILAFPGTYAEAAGTIVFPSGVGLLGLGGPDVTTFQTSGFGLVSNTLIENVTISVPGGQTCVSMTGQSSTVRNCVLVGEGGRRAIETTIAATTGNRIENVVLGTGTFSDEGALFRQAGTLVVDGFTQIANVAGDFIRTDGAANATVVSLSNAVMVGNATDAGVELSGNLDTMYASNVQLVGACDTGFKLSADAFLDLSGCMSYATTNDFEITAGNTAASIRAEGMMWGGTELNSAPGEIVVNGSQIIADPGNTGTITPGTHPARQINVTVNIGAGGESTDLAIPRFVGQRCTINVNTTAGGTRGISTPIDFDSSNNSTATLNTVDETIEFVAVNTVGTLRWQLAFNDGAVLS